MHWIWTTFFLFLGLCVGSFLNVCIYRIPNRESIVFPGSHCPKCNHMIKWYENIPLISCLFLRGKCSNCKAGISIRYFCVELLTGLMFLSVWFKIHPIATLKISLLPFLIFVGLCKDIDFVVEINTTNEVILA